MKIGFLITVRLKSSRLKLKVLQPLNGFSVIERVIQRAKQVIECSDVVLCTSQNNQDLPLIRIAQKHAVYYYNGSSEDVLQRLLEACELFDFDYFIGMTADNPLFSIYHAQLLSDKIRADNSIDYIYTTGMPIGVNIYAIKTKALKTVCKIKKEIDTEIWGYLLNRPEIFNVEELKVEPHYEFNQLPRLTLDEIDDYKLFKAIYNEFDKDEIIDLLDVYTLLSNNPTYLELNQSVQQADLDDAIKQRINHFYKANIDKILAIKKDIYHD
ncbi:MAG: 3-deoxy-manno-octulosonate cytidylyltransferase [Methylococcales bacterium]|jgi:spore coat polysaccharide biosynthesis protein SpsF|nr:3-deoxy-manno-octulosonate cytidylyltransferase [Methylococcales bacterium]MBT7408993.1 3-deoxy-manno-octulosonate cytidylyltransferase [Methylococcales bacterium]